MKKIVFFGFSMLFLAVLILVIITWRFITSAEIINQKTYIKTFPNRDASKQVTIILTIRDASHDEFSFIRIVPGRFQRSDFPQDVANCIDFPESTGVYIEWISSRDLIIYASREPEVNSFSLENVKSKIIVDRHRLDVFEKEGKEVIWNKIKNPDVFEIK